MNINETVKVIQVSSFPTVSVEDEMDEKYLEVVLSDVFTPSFFWIHLRENKKKLKLMMDELQ